MCRRYPIKERRKERFLPEFLSNSRHCLSSNPPVTAVDCLFHLGMKETPAGSYAKTEREEEIGDPAVISAGIHGSGAQLSVPPLLHRAPLAPPTLRSSRAPIRNF